MLAFANVRRSLAAAGMLGLMACQTAPLPQPAVLEAETPEAMTTIGAVLSEATGRARVELGATNLTQEPSIPVLPPRPTAAEGNSPAMPTMFDLVMTPEGCFVQHRASGELHALPGVVCKPAGGTP